MPSAINPAFPVTGNPTTQSVRTNFQAAKTEIEALQAAEITDVSVDGILYGRQDKGWLPVTVGTGVPEAPVDTKSYVRKDAAWVEAEPGGIEEAPDDGTVYGRKMVEDPGPPVTQEMEWVDVNHTDLSDLLDDINGEPPTWAFIIDKLNGEEI